jgi:sulfur carrier protein
VASGTAVCDAKLRLLVNGEPRDVPAGCTVEQLVESLGLNRGRIAVAVNRDVVPRSRFGAHPLAAGDRIEILEAVGGG